MSKSDRPSKTGLSCLRTVGSLWLAAVLLSLISVAMACATVFESVHGTENALAFFYKSWWFESLLALLAVNAASAIITRYPFSRRQLGFLTTHCSLLLILAGALITQKFGIDGRLFIVEGQSQEAFTLPQEVLRLSIASAETSMEISPPRMLTTQPADLPDPPSLVHGDVRAEVVRYAPESTVLTEMADDGPHPQLAVEVSFSADGLESPVWIMAGQLRQVGEVEIACRQLNSEEELRRLTSTVPATQPAGKGLVRIEYQGTPYELPLEDCLAATQPVDQTGLSLRVLRYLPHAVVAGRGKLDNASNEPMNPAIEVELTGAGGTERRFAFARFPDFQSMHGHLLNPDVKIVLAMPDIAPQSAPVEILSGPGDALHVRFSNGREFIVQELRPGVASPTPFPDRKLSVLRVFKNARVRQTVLPGRHSDAEPAPAILVRLTTGSESSETWVQKRRHQTIALGGQPYHLDYEDKSVPLGFKVALESFKIRNYPGTSRPRSYESRITISDPATGAQDSRIISMNRPTSYGRYTFYQSSYHDLSGRMASVLSVSWDPGKPLVFAGYGLMMAGMLLVLINRLRASGGPSRENADRGNGRTAAR